MMKRKASVESFGAPEAPDAPEPEHSDEPESSGHDQQRQQQQQQVQEQGLQEIEDVGEEAGPQPEVDEPPVVINEFNMDGEPPVEDEVDEDEEEDDEDNGDLQQNRALLARLLEAQDEQPVDDRAVLRRRDGRPWQFDHAGMEDGVFMELIRRNFEVRVVRNAANIHNVAAQEIMMLRAQEQLNEFIVISLYGEERHGLRTLTLEARIATYKRIFQTNNLEMYTWQLPAEVRRELFIGADVRQDVAPDVQPGHDAFQRIFDRIAVDDANRGNLTPRPAAGDAPEAMVREPTPSAAVHDDDDGGGGDLSGLEDDFIDVVTPNCASDTDSDEECDQDEEPDVQEPDKLELVVGAQQSPTEKFLNNSHLMQAVLSNVFETMGAEKKPFLDLRLVNKDFNTACLLSVRLRFAKLTIAGYVHAIDRFGMYIDRICISGFTFEASHMYRFFRFLSTLPNLRITSVVHEDWFLKPDSGFKLESGDDEQRTEDEGPSRDRLMQLYEYHEQIMAEILRLKRNVRVFKGAEAVCDPGCRKCVEFVRTATTECGPLQFMTVRPHNITSPVHFRKLIVSDNFIYRLLKESFMPTKAETMRIALKSINKNVTCSFLEMWMYSINKAACVESAREDVAERLEALIALRMIYKPEKMRIVNYVGGPANNTELCIGNTVHGLDTFNVDPTVLGYVPDNEPLLKELTIDLRNCYQLSHPVVIDRVQTNVDGLLRLFPAKVSYVLLPSYRNVRLRPPTKEQLEKWWSGLEQESLSAGHTLSDELMPSRDLENFLKAVRCLEAEAVESINLRSYCRHLISYTRLNQLHSNIADIAMIVKTAMDMDRNSTRNRTVMVDVCFDEAPEMDESLLASFLPRKRPNGTSLDWTMGSREARELWKRQRSPSANPRTQYFASLSVKSLNYVLHLRFTTTGEHRLQG